MADLNSIVKQTWQDLHNMPEASLKEFKTSKYISDRLKAYGYSVQDNIANTTAIMATLQGSEPGPVVGLRADMDALLHMVDDKEMPIHSCGHDAHSAMLLTAAEEIARRGIKKGSLKLLFQPAEETLQGAKIFCDNGQIDDLDYLIGFHLRPVHEAPMGKATPALCHGANRLIEAVIHGVPAHGARTHLGVNVINAAAAIVNAVNAIKTVPTTPATTKVTRIIADAGAANAIPESAKISLDLRAQTNVVMEELIEKTRQAILLGAQTVGATADILVCAGCPAAEYHDEVTNLLRQCIVEELGNNGLLEPILSPGSEDFHFFVKHNPDLKVGYWGLGVDLEPGLHHPQMHFNVDGLVAGVNIVLRSVDKLNLMK